MGYWWLKLPNGLNNTSAAGRALWKEMGFTAEDVNAANDFAWEVALPNVVKVAEACRALDLPMIIGRDVEHHHCDDHAEITSAVARQ